jgi:nucleotide-binding universal stress UspA family protein
MARRGPIRILVGVDFSRESLAALRAARALVAHAGGRITVTHVRPSSNMRAAVVENRGDLLREDPGKLAAGLADHYARRLGRLRRPGETVLLLEGVAAPALCREARRGYDLLYLGDRGRGRVAAFLLGSTARTAVSRSPIPVVVTRLTRLPARRGRMNSGSGS